MKRAKDYQLKLSEQEMTRLGNRVLTDYRNALGDHNRRITRWAEYMRRWRGRTDDPLFGEETKSNYPVPLIRWNVFAQWAKEMDSLFGDDAEIVAVPVGPSDYRKVKKIGAYMTWRVFNSMKLMNPFCVFVLRKILFGRAVAYSPYSRDTYDVNGKEIVDYEGPEFTPLHPDDFICPVEEVQSLHDFSWVMRRYRVTPDQLLQGEEEGKYQGITADFENILNSSRSRQGREFQGEEIKREQDEAEGLNYNIPLSSGNSLVVLEWHGKWRKLKGKTDADEWSTKGRELREADWVVRFLLDTNKVIGVQDLAELYPLKKDKRPFVESSMVKDGSYWAAGLAEMLIDSEDELRVNHNLATQALQFAIGPLIFFRPASGFNTEKFKYEPMMTVPVDNPATDVKVVELRADLEPSAIKEQSILSYVERLSGLTDGSMGRTSDRPNQPRTARGQIALLEEGNVRLSLNTKVLAEDMSAILQHFWELEYMFTPDQMFFRITEDDADGLFPVHDGGAMLNSEDRDGRYDFRMKFANSVYSREAEKEKTLARYQLDLQNPLIAQNPRALWKITQDVHAAMGDPNFADLVPEPPDEDQPVNPKEEWTRLLQGEEITVNPLDNDELHLLRHMKDLKAAEADPNRDMDAVKKLIVHYTQQLDQLQHKKIMQAAIEQGLQQMQQQGGPGGAMMGQPPGAAGPAGLAGPPAPVQAPNPLAEAQPELGGGGPPQPGAPPQ